MKPGAGQRLSAREAAELSPHHHDARNFLAHVELPAHILFIGILDEPDSNRTRLGSHQSSLRTPIQPHRLGRINKSSLGIAMPPDVTWRILTQISEEPLSDNPSARVNVQHVVYVVEQF